MKAKIIITSNDSVEIIGKLFVNNDNDEQIFSCDVLDLPDKIAAGIYNCHKTHMNDMNANHFEIQNVPGHTKVFIHNGNFASGKKIDTEACVLVGNGFADIDKNGEPDILNSVKTLEKFEEIIGGNDFPLEFIYSLSI